MASADDRLDVIRDLLEPVVTPLGLSLYDVRFGGSGRGRTLQVVVERAGGVDLDALESATRRISTALDPDPTLRGPYTLEVTSPGLERALRRPEHFAGALGALVSVKARDAHGVMRRLRGVLTAADATSITVLEDSVEHVVAIDAIDEARTVFEWAPAPKPGKGSRPGRVKHEKVSSA